jgi:hypothetical protein
MMKRIAAVLGAAMTVSALFPVAHAVAEVEATANLKVSVTGPASVTPGSRVTYQMTIRNEGPDTVQSASAHATWSPNFHIPSDGFGVRGVSGPCAWNLERPEVTCGVENMPIAPGSARTVSFTGTVDQTASGQVELTANVLSPGTTDPVADDNSGQATSLVVPAPIADLKVNVTGPASVTPGSSATYRMTIRNEGPDTLKSVSAHATWSRNFTLPTYGLTGVSGFCGWTAGAPEVSCTVAGGPMAPGDTRTVTFTGTVDQTASGQVELTANVMLAPGSYVDPVPDDNSGRATSLVVPAATLASR